MIDSNLFNMGAEKMSEYLSVLFGCLSVFLPYVIGLGLLFISINFFLSFIRSKR